MSAKGGGLWPEVGRRMHVQATVIVPTFEDWDGLQVCLDCLAMQSIGQDRVEIIVANNNPAPTVPDRLRLAANVRVIHVPKPGSYAARNAALGLARTDVVFFTDSDCAPDPDWISSGLAAMASLGPSDRVAGRIELFSRGKCWTGPELYDRMSWLHQDSYVRSGWCATANLVARRAAFDLVGPFNEDRFSGGDKEWNLRATALGSRLVFSAETLVRHPARKDFADLAKKSRRLTGGRHYEEERGLRPRRPLRGYLAFLSLRDVRKILNMAGLTEAEKLKLMWVCFRLGAVQFAEVMRLRYFSSTARRS